MRNSADVKDKSIRLQGVLFHARVDYYNGKTIDCGLHDSIHRAQKALAKYPRDVWDGYDCQDYRYKEPRIVRKDNQRGKRVRPHGKGLEGFGRTLAGSFGG